MSLLERIDACNRHEPAEFIPFAIGEVAVGWVRPAFAERLARFGEVFAVSSRRVALRPRFWAFRERSEALDGVVRALVDDGTLPRYHGERYPVTASSRDRALCTVDRAAAPWFGLRAFGQHLNGFVRRADGPWLWVARRARGKWNFPGRLDQLVAGGLPYGLSLAENLVKECAEEAAVPELLAQQATPVGLVSYCLATPTGLKPDVLYCYDLELPADFVPRPVDGEVEAFELWPLEEVAATVRDGEAFKPNCALVVIDFLLRHGWLEPGDPDYLEIAGGLRRHPGLPPEPAD